MLLDLSKLQTRKLDEITFSDTITLDESLYQNTDIRKLLPLLVDIKVKRVADFSYKMLLHIKGTMILPCSVTLKDVTYPFEINTEIKVSNDEEDEEYVKINQNSIDIIPIIWQNIVLEIPLRVVSEDVSDTPTSGDGWRLIRDE